MKYKLDVNSILWKGGGGGGCGVCRDLYTTRARMHIASP